MAQAPQRQNSVCVKREGRQELGIWRSRPFTPADGVAGLSHEWELCVDTMVAAYRAVIVAHMACEGVDSRDKGRHFCRVSDSALHFLW